jgi:Family of unknown function (DUF5519)
MGAILDRIRGELLSWPGVSEEPHRFGGVEFRVDGHEIGHLHGERLADLPFPRRVRDALVAAGRARRHHVLPDTGWVSVPLHTEADAGAVIELFRMNYDRVMAARRRRASAFDASSDASADAGSDAGPAEAAQPEPA